MVWRAVSRSVIGSSHLKHQLPCQDYGGDRILNDVILGAVADGAGSAKYADIGSKLAVKVSLDILTKSEEWLRKRRRSWLFFPQPPSQQQMSQFFTKVVTEVLAMMQAQASKDGYSVEDLACTLLIFVATPRWIAAMQIGDGFIVVRSQNSDYQLLFQPDKGEFANQTTFVTSSSALQEMQVKVLSKRPTFICAATDALEHVAIRLRDWTAFPPFFQPLEEYLTETPNPEQDDAYLLSFLESERLNQRTDDDKTLLLCLYEEK